MMSLRCAASPTPGKGLHGRIRDHRRRIGDELVERRLIPFDVRRQAARVVGEALDLPCRLAEDAMQRRAEAVVFRLDRMAIAAVGVEGDLAGIVA